MATLLTILLTLSATDGEFFETRIRPVLVEHCYKCHSAEAAAKKKLKGGLRLDTRAGIRRGGDSGAAVVPGRPEASLILSALRYEELEMPPQGKLPESVIRDFVRWIESGAADPRDGDVKLTPPPIDRQSARELWAFRPPGQPVPPATVDTDWPAGAIDRFILARLESEGLRPAEPADARTLIRRASYDLTGLPPTVEEIEAFELDFLRDPSGAFGRVVDRLLGSPHFGVHWARFWLDNVRFAQDDHSCAAFILPGFRAEPYRDWVVRAFNDDLPYDQFVRYQIAGDLIGTDDPTRFKTDAITATGIWTFPHVLSDADFDRLLADFVDQQIDVLGRTFLGLTLACARCHDHKFDPISQREYYSLAGIFFSSHSLTGEHPDSGAITGGRSAYRVESPLVSSRAELDDYRQLQKERRETTKKLGRMKRNYPEAFQIRETRRKLEKETARTTPNEERLTELRGKETSLDQAIRKKYGLDKTEAMLVEFDRETKREAELKQKLNASPGRAAMQDGGAPRGPHAGKTEDMRVYVRGNHANQGEIAPRGFPEILTWDGAPSVGKTSESGRRELADWVTDARHPLTARVMANRIWQQLFGAGLVRTPSNFGRLGEPPTHPELLDDLAHRFVEGGWSVKSLVREILSSRTYQQSSSSAPSTSDRDPENRLLAWHTPRRLTSESLRDSLLDLGGKLSRETPANELSGSGRSLYLKVSRIDERDDLFTLFDTPDPSLLVDHRSETTTATQSLFMLNHSFVLETAARWSERLAAEVTDDSLRIQIAYRQLCGRYPTDDERITAREFLAAAEREWLELSVEPMPKDATDTGDVSHGPEMRPKTEKECHSNAWRDLCHVLLCSNHFFYVR